jgi:hypothetical protein
MNERPVIVTSEDAVEAFVNGGLVWSLTIADLVFVGEYTLPRLATITFSNSSRRKTGWGVGFRLPSMPMGGMKQ